MVVLTPVPPGPGNVLSFNADPVRERFFFLTRLRKIPDRLKVIGSIIPEPGWNLGP